MLAPIRLTNAAALFLPVLPTPLRGYCCAVRQNERQLPCGSGETQGDASPPPIRTTLVDKGRFLGRTRRDACGAASPQPSPSSIESHPESATNGASPPVTQTAPAATLCKNLPL